MPHDINVVRGSGTVANLANLGPILSPLYPFDPNTFEVPNARDTVRNQRADAVAVVNPSDFSVNLGGRVTQIDISTSAVQILTSPLEFRRALVIHNNGGSTVYFGFSASVTTSTGFPLVTNEKIAIDMVGNPNMNIWLISDSASDVRLLELA